jgi:hypothetical protein
LLKLGIAASPAAAGTWEAGIIVKNIMVGKRGNVFTIEPTADLTAAVKPLAERRIGAVVRCINTVI